MSLEHSEQAGVPEGFLLAASSFNWTSEVIAADRDAAQLALDVVREGVASIVELEPGQLWRAFPNPRDDEVDAFAAELEALDGGVSIVGLSIDEFAPDGRRRSEEERLAFLLPQIYAAKRVGARGGRLPIGQAGGDLWDRLSPTLAELDFVLFEEIQGQQTPGNPSVAAAIDNIVGRDDPRIRLLVDISMLMPALPTTYLERLRAGGIPGRLMDRLDAGWLDDDTIPAVVEFLHSGQVPPRIQTMYMNLLIRFGRSKASDLRGILPWVGAFHLKFWDLDNADGRVFNPIVDLGDELATFGFVGTLCSEWGGHEWLDESASEFTVRHLEGARLALAEGAART